MRTASLASALLLCSGLLAARPASAFFFSTGDPDGRMAMAARETSTGVTGIETADDFVLGGATRITHATFTGLMVPTAGQPMNVADVNVAIYRVFPLDSNTGRTPLVPTRVNSPSDVELLGRSAAGGTLSFGSTVLQANFTAGNSVFHGIHPSPNQTTGGEGAVTGQEVRFDVSFITPIDLDANHYDFVPQVELNGGTFYWLSSSLPITSGTPFSPDLQTWIRDDNLAPDWLRVGRDIVGGGTPPQYNASFTLEGADLAAVPEPTSAALLALGALAGAGALAARRRG